MPSSLKQALSRIRKCKDNICTTHIALPQISQIGTKNPVLWCLTSLIVSSTDLTPTMTGSKILRSVIDLRKCKEVRSTSSDQLSTVPVHVLSCGYQPTLMTPSSCLPYSNVLNITLSTLYCTGHLSVLLSTNHWAVRCAPTKLKAIGL